MSLDVLIMLVQHCACSVSKWLMLRVDTYRVSAQAGKRSEKIGVSFPVWKHRAQSHCPLIVTQVD